MYYDSYFSAKPTSIGSAMNIKLNKVLIRKIADVIAASGNVKVCEIGYGRGLFADSLHEYFKGMVDYYAVEPNQQLANEGRKKGHHIIETKIPPFPDESDWVDFDIILFSHVLEHFCGYETVLDVLGEAVKRLKNGGIIVSFFPDYLDYKDDYFSVDFSHEYILTLRRMKQLFHDVNLNVIMIKNFRSYFLFPMASIIYPFHLIIKLVAGVAFKLTGKDKFFKMRITFAKNILMIAKKQDVISSQ